MSKESKSEKEKVEILKKAVKDGKHIFLLIFMNGCGPCENTKPKWYEFEKNNSDNDRHVIVDIEQSSLGDVKDLIGESPNGFPCMRYIHNGKVEDYENCEKLDKTNLRSVESFEDWLKIKTGNEKTGGKRRRKMQTRKKGRKGGKWSLKYKRSINCRRPKGFSQRQHCKYGRKKI
jgi:thiol-disulfide isomerase/thioredoxin